MGEFDFISLISSNIKKLIEFSKMSNRTKPKDQIHKSRIIDQYYGVGTADKILQKLNNNQPSLMHTQLCLAMGIGIFYHQDKGAGIIMFIKNKPLKTFQLKFFDGASQNINEALTEEFYCEISSNGKDEGKFFYQFSSMAHNRIVGLQFFDRGEFAKFSFLLESKPMKRSRATSQPQVPKSSQPANNRVKQDLKNTPALQT